MSGRCAVCVGVVVAITVLTKTAPTHGAPSVSEPAPIFTVYPTAVMARPGTRPQLQVAVSSISPIAYRWQVSTDQGTSWTELSDGALFSGVTTNILTINSITLGMTGSQYKCIATNSAGSTASQPSTLTVTSPGDLAVSFGAQYGTWLLTGASWTPLHGLSPIAMVTADLDGNFVDDVVLNFGPGFGVYAWMNNVTWTFIHPLSPSQMAAGDLDHNGHDDIVFVFPGSGIWRWSDGNWFNLNGMDATRLAIGNLDGQLGDELIADFPRFGLYIFANNAAWIRLHGLDANALLTADIDGNGQDDLVVNFGAGFGLWVYRNNSTWIQVHGLSPTHIATGDIDGGGGADLVIDFGAPYGLWTFRNGTTWVPLHWLSADSIVLADRDGSGTDEIVIDFGSLYGLWQYANDSSWNQLHVLSPETVAAGWFH